MFAALLVDTHFAATVPRAKVLIPSHQHYKQRTFAGNEHSTDNNRLARSGKMRSSQFLLKICLKVFKTFLRKLCPLTYR
jgi:hypothetical protein